MNDVPRYEKHVFTEKKHDYCVCVFVINESQRLHNQLNKMMDLSKNHVDIVIADGGSTDGSTQFDTLKNLGVHALLVKTDTGKLGSQMRMAFDWALKAGYRVIVTIDGNGKDGIEAIPRFIEKLKEGFDHIQGSRYIPGGHHENTPLSRHIGVKILHIPVIRIASGFPYTDATNGFRAYSKNFLESNLVLPFRDCFTGYEFHYYLAIRAARCGFKVCEVPVSRIYPATGPTPTKITPIRGYINVISKLFKAAFGHYNPPKGK